MAQPEDSAPSLDVTADPSLVVTSNDGSTPEPKLLPSFDPVTVAIASEVTARSPSSSPLPIIPDSSADGVAVTSTEPPDERGTISAQDSFVFTPAYEQDPDQEPDQEPGTELGAGNEGTKDEEEEWVLVTEPIHMALDDQPELCDGFPPVEEPSIDLLSSQQVPEEPEQVVPELEQVPGLEFKEPEPVPEELVLESELVAPEPEPALEEPEPESELVLEEPEPEPKLEPEPEPVLEEPEPELVLEEPEPEPKLEPEPEPEPVLEEREPEPELVLEEPEPEPKLEPEPVPELMLEEPEPEPELVLEEPEPEPKLVLEEPEPEPESVLEEPEPEPELVLEEPEPEPKLVLEEPEPEPESVLEEPEPEPELVLEEPEPEPELVLEEPEPEPESVLEEPEPEPELVLEEPEPEPELVLEEPEPEPELVLEEPEPELLPQMDPAPSLDQDPFGGEIPVPTLSMELDGFGGEPLVPAPTEQDAFGGEIPEEEPESAPSMDFEPVPAAAPEQVQEDPFNDSINEAVQQDLQPAEPEPCFQVEPELDLEAEPELNIEEEGYQQLEKRDDSLIFEGEEATSDVLMMLPEDTEKDMREMLDDTAQRIQRLEDQQMKPDEMPGGEEEGVVIAAPDVDAIEPVPPPVGDSPQSEDDLGSGEEDVGLLQGEIEPPRGPGEEEETPSPEFPPEELGTSDEAPLSHPEVPSDEPEDSTTEAPPAEVPVGDLFSFGQAEEPFPPPSEAPTMDMFSFEGTTDSTEEAPLPPPSEAPTMDMFSFGTAEEAPPVSSSEVLTANLFSMGTDEAPPLPPSSEVPTGDFLALGEPADVPEEAPPLPPSSEVPTDDLFSLGGPPDVPDETPPLPPSSEVPMDDFFSLGGPADVPDETPPLPPSSEVPMDDFEEIPPSSLYAEQPVPPLAPSSLSDLFSFEGPTGDEGIPDGASLTPPPGVVEVGSTDQFPRDGEDTAASNGLYEPTDDSTQFQPSDATPTDSGDDTAHAPDVPGESEEEEEGVDASLDQSEDDNIISQEEEG